MWASTTSASTRCSDSPPPVYAVRSYMIYKSFKKFIRKAFDTMGVEDLHPVADVSAFIQKAAKDAGINEFSGEEMQAA
ncbi:hypothetical protein PRIPAC_73462 [Pristionchus pacificus]|uniref:Uncharacterized protein n=1 Tax=Pristionchus pacificus TaxID=54126 RepID=A0A2A6C8L3_PRIPA|nr:hypothetical protein PRIPAC_73462 [Pristionchus pacificus]|eukprot:PDM74499.1 hypothetical protein PRIPAC_41855 [Pristionchus pacificus]